MNVIQQSWPSWQVLELLWNLAHRDDCPTDTMDHALNAHIKILDYSCSQVRVCTCTCVYSRTMVAVTDMIRCNDIRCIVCRHLQLYVVCAS